jgi:hypothetical protein
MSDKRWWAGVWVFRSKVVVGYGVGDTLGVGHHARSGRQPILELEVRVQWAEGVGDLLGVGHHARGGHQPDLLAREVGLRLLDRRPRLFPPSATWMQKGTPRSSQHSARAFHLVQRSWPDSLTAKFEMDLQQSAGWIALQQLSLRSSQSAECHLATMTEHVHLHTPSSCALPARPGPGHPSPAPPPAPGSNTSGFRFQVGRVLSIRPHAMGAGRCRMCASDSQHQQTR